MLDKYGVENPFQVEAFKDKIKKTNLEKYGSENPYAFGSSKYKNIIKEKYGVDNVFQSEQIKAKIKESNLEKYGVENASQCESVKQKIRDTYNNKTPEEKNVILEKAKKTFNKNYGTDWALQSDIVKEKIKNTNLERYGAMNCLSRGTEPYLKRNMTVKEKYGVDNVFQDEVVKEKSKNTFLEKYGVEHALQDKEFFDKARSYYKYNNENFDSSWELAYYIYNLDNNINIIHEPCCFEYSYNNITHKYYPDFSINGQLYEIKGDHFFENGILINPYDRTQDGLAYEKYKCMLEHNVIILKYNDMKNILDYIKIKYGRDYLTSFRRVSNE